MKELLHNYTKYPAFYEQDINWSGFEWINADDNYRSIYSFVRKSKNGKNNILCVFNFTPMAYPDYRVGTLSTKQHRLILDSETYWDEKRKVKKLYKPEAVACDGKKTSFAYPLAPYGVAEFVY